ncbi:MAG: HAD-IIIA family hydrolase [Ginsengibacter sp.]
MQIRMIKEAIILAGGLGTRLRSVIFDTPKCMAPVAGKPFLNHLIFFLQKQGIENFIFSVGYMHEVIEKYLEENYPQLNFIISLEEEPLGTGGAIKLACKKTSAKNLLVCNGDTLYKIDCNSLNKLHLDKGSSCTLSLKPMNNFDRYGAIELNPDNSIKSFKEKQFYQSGLINGGVYALNIEEFLKEDFPEKFSFEKDYLEKRVDNQMGRKSKLFGMIQDEYFIDIGIPEDYERAQVELKTSPQPLSKGEENAPGKEKFDLQNIDSTWALFIDRDGVVNDEKHLDYIHTWQEFKFYKGVKEAFQIFNKKFGHIIMVTNQRGVAKGLTKLEDLQLIHKNMKKEIQDAGGRIDEVYVCTEMESPNRKPNPGMGLQALKDFPDIELSKSIMIGNTLSDMQFGRNLGVKINVFLPTTRKDVDLKNVTIDMVFNDLISVANAL